MGFFKYEIATHEMVKDQTDEFPLRKTNKLLDSFITEKESKTIFVYLNIRKTREKKN